MIMVAYRPIVTLQGFEGKMFVRMAATVLLALLGAMIFSLTFVPAAVSIWLGRKLAEKENVFMRAAKRFYVPLLDRTLRKRGLILSGAVIVLALSFAVFTRLGGEFIPTLDEGDLGLEIYRVVGTGMAQAVKIFGDDLELLTTTAEKIRAVLVKIRGAVEPKVQQVEGLPLLTIQLKRDELARYGLSVGEVQDVVEMAIGGKNAGEVFEGDRRFPLVVRLPEDLRTDLDALRHIPLALPKSDHANQTLNLASPPPAFITLDDVADLQMAQVPNEIGRENGKRVVTVTSNVRGRDLRSFFADEQRAVGG